MSIEIECALAKRLGSKMKSYAALTELHNVSYTRRPNIHMP